MSFPYYDKVNFIKGDIYTNATPTNLGLIKFGLNHNDESFAFFKHNEFTPTTPNQEVYFKLNYKDCTPYAENINSIPPANISSTDNKSTFSYHSCFDHGNNNPIHKFGQVQSIQGTQLVINETPQGQPFDSTKNVTFKNITLPHQLMAEYLLSKSLKSFHVVNPNESTKLIELDICHRHNGKIIECAGN